MTVWPYLLAGCAVTAYWNWRAALMLALAVGMGQLTTRAELPQAQLLGGYTLLAVVAMLFVDRYSGLVLAAFGLVIGAHIIGAIGHMPKVIAGEVLLVAGMLISAFNGPSGGLWERGVAAATRGCNALVASRTVGGPEAAVHSKAAD
jgi:hypothetical protein